MVLALSRDKVQTNAEPVAATARFGDPFDPPTMRERAPGTVPVESHPTGCDEAMPDQEVTPEIIDLILRTSRVKGCWNIYALAPRGYRVGMYFQQRRATLLAAAIRSRIGEAHLEDLPIAIVGGGVSGLTFLLAIRSQGARQAHLFEVSDDLVSTGQHARHRLIHPNYNRWPLLGSMDSFTTLPMLNWCAGPADKVVAQLRQELATRHSDVVEDCVHRNHRVVEVLQRSPDLANPLQLKLNVGGVEVKKDFRMVVIAAGFDGERSTEWGFEDYWNQSADIFDRSTHQRPSMVYGVGDGALIDVVRCCAKSPENAWAIPLGTIARVRSHEALNLRQDGIQRLDVRAPGFTAFEKRIQVHEESIRSVAWAGSRAKPTAANVYATEEAKFYFQCIDDLRGEKPGLIRFIEDELKPVAPPHLKPTLVGVLGSAFEPTSAPINKLLLAYLLATDRITYARRSSTRQITELERWHALPEYERARTITICRFGARRNFPLGNTATHPPNGIIVSVEGAGPVACETDAEANLIDALSGVTGGEYVYFDMLPDPMTQARLGDNRERVAELTRDSNKPILEDFARKHLGASNVTFKGLAAHGPKWVVTTDWSSTAITAGLEKVGGLDGMFFGIPIVVAGPTGRTEDNF